LRIRWCGRGGNLRRGRRRCLNGSDLARKACRKDSVARTASKVRVEKGGGGGSMSGSSKLGKVWPSRNRFCKCGKCRSYGYGINRGGGFQNQTIGNPDGYQKKGVRGEAKRIVVKTKGIAKVAQIWARRSGWGSGPSRTSLGVNKSGVEQFEWGLLTLVSVPCFLLLSQELFI